MASPHIQLLARVDDLARREGLIATDTGKARIYRDPIAGTVMWLPHGRERLELTLIQVRMAAEPRAARLHQLLAGAVGKDVTQIPPHDLGLGAEEAVVHWDSLEEAFFPSYLSAHREVHAGHR